MRDLGKGPQIKALIKNTIYPVVKPSSIEITNALNTLQILCLFHKVGNDLLLQRFESKDVHDAGRKQSGILIYFERK